MRGYCIKSCFLFFKEWVENSAEILLSVKLYQDKGLHPKFMLESLYNAKITDRIGLWRKKD